MSVDSGPASTLPGRPLSEITAEARNRLTGNGVCWVTEAELELIQSWLCGRPGKETE